jgi:hypothetical protein
MKRFWDKVDKNGQCWKWKAATNANGYGIFGINRGCKLAHRVSYEMAHGPIPEGLCVCHTCDNKPCVNPAHLWVGTVADNNADRDRKGRASGGGLKGQDHSQAKLTADDVENIRANEMNLTQRELGEIFGVSQTLISHIIRRKIWSHV